MEHVAGARAVLVEGAMSRAAGVGARQLTAGVGGRTRRAARGWCWWREVGGAANCMAGAARHGAGVCGCGVCVGLGEERVSFTTI